MGEIIDTRPHVFQFAKVGWLLIADASPGTVERYWPSTDHDMDSVLLMLGCSLVGLLGWVAFEGGW